MSRWSRKSQAEKNEMALKDFERRKVEPKVMRPFKGGFNDDDAVTILKNFELPIGCPHCLKWSSCDKYEVGLYKTMMTGDREFPAIQGICKTCGKMIRRVIPANEEIALWALIVPKLRAEGRFTGEWMEGK